MKLLICTTEYFPQGAGIANVAYNVVEQLKRMDVDCTVCSPIGPDIKLGSQNLIQKTGIIGLLNYWNQVSHYFKDNDYYDAVWLHNPFITADNPFEQILVTMHSTYYGSSTRGVGNLPFHYYKSFVSHFERYCLTHMPPTTLFTGVAQTVCEELENIGISRKRIINISNGVNTGQFHPSQNKKFLRRKFNIPEDDVVLLSVGRLTPAKQPSTMIEVFSHIEKRMRNVTLCIAGKGELYEATKKLAQKRGLSKVLFLGYVDHDKDLPDLYACADYYIMTSKYEGTPLTLLEAMASGLPCIVSDIQNLSEIVLDANCGLVTSFVDTKIAADMVVEYITKEQSIHARNGLKYTLDKLNWSSISEEYINSIKKLSEGGSYIYGNL